MAIYRNKAYKQNPKSFFIRNGLGGNMDTVSIMKNLARKRSKEPVVRDLALNILRSYGITSHQYLNECMAIGDYVKNNVRYLRDIDNVERLEDPLLMIQNLAKGTAAGDCDDMSLLIATLLLSIGAQPFFRVVRYQGKHGPYNHIYVVCYERNGKTKPKRVVLDAIVKDKPIGYEVPHTSGEDFKV